MIKLDNETAVNELKRFTEKLKVNKLKLEKLEEEIESVTSCIEEGYVAIMDNGDVECTLMYPIKDDEGEVAFEKLIFASRRVRVDDLEKKMTGKTDLEKARKMLGYLSKTNAKIFAKMDADDFKVCSDIAAFFLPR